MTIALKNQQKVRIELQFPDLHSRFQRLRGVGGFISILGRDPRVLLFCRYNHVNRVVALTEYLVNMLEIEESQKIMFLAHFHDINRLPLSYVTEKALKYNQALNLRPYLNDCSDIIPENYISALEAVVSKNTNHSFDVRFVYLSDMVVNFVEDLLFAITLLDISPDFLPEELLAAMGMDSSKAELNEDTAYLKLYFTGNINLFPAFFQATAKKYMLRFIKRLGGIGIFLSDDPVEKSNAVLTVKSFLVKSIFPVVDEDLVKEKSLVHKVVLPYFESLMKAQINPFESLWDMTDRQFLKTAVKMGLIKHDEVETFRPVLEPDKAICARGICGIKEYVSL